jgi:hypothetical protein
MKRFLNILMIIIFVLPISANAESVDNPLILEELAIQIMPEYSYHPKDTKKNHPPLLIGYQGTFMNTSEQSKKGKIEIPVPDGQKDIQIGFVADYSSDLSEMYEIEYDLDKKRNIISWETTRKILPGDLYKFVIEFYSNEIQEEADEKSLEYTFKSFTDIGLVNITFLEPLKTDSTRLQPEPESHQENPYGMNMFMYQIQEMKMGDDQTYQLNYKRSSKQTTVELMNQIDGNHEEKPVEPKKVETKELSLVIGGVSAFSLISAILLVFILRKRKNVITASIVSASPKPHEDDEKAYLRNKLVLGELTKQEYEKQVKDLTSLKRKRL